MRRRSFITLLGGAAAAWPMAAWAQQANPTIGLLSGVAFDAYADRLEVFRKGLAEAGYTEGRNLTIEFRSAQSQYNRLPELAADLVRRNVAVIVAIGGGGPGRVAKQATSTIPIVFAAGSDPAEVGIVASFSRPDANVTGVSLNNTALAPKRLELLRDLLPNVSRVGFLVNQTSTGFESNLREMPSAARSIGADLVILQASNATEIDAAFVRAAEQSVSALVVSNDSLFTGKRQQVIALAARNRLPAVYGAHEFVVDGGLMSYASSIKEVYRQAALYVGRILKGEKPADLPIVQPTKFDLAINLKTARALNVTFPMTLQVAADEVIE